MRAPSVFTKTSGKDIMDYAKLLENSLYLLALLNPASKVMFLSTYEPTLTKRQIWELSWKSSVHFDFENSGL